MQTDLMTPQEIDTRLAALDREHAVAEQRVHAAIVEIRRSVGELQAARRSWATTDAQAIAKAIRAVAAPDFTPAPLYSVASDPWWALSSYDAAVEAVREVEGRMAPLDAEYARRGGWTRFFTVAGGHIHDGMDCSTCNRNGNLTRFGWNPELSGLDAAAAVARLGPALCSVCYPAAPVEWTVGLPAKPACPGSGQAPVESTTRRVGMNTYAECGGCGERERVTQAGVIRKHPPATSK